MKELLKKDSTMEELIYRTFFPISINGIVKRATNGNDGTKLFISCSKQEIDKILQLSNSGIIVNKFGVEKKYRSAEIEQHGEYMEISFKGKICH